MDIKTGSAIIAIAVVIPLTSVVVYSTDFDQRPVRVDNPKLQAVSAFGPLYEFAQEVGQQKVDVALLVPAGVKPHDWEPTIRDVQRMQQADFVIINGRGFENWVDSLVENDYQGIIVDTSVGVMVKRPDVSNNESHESGDPHIWLNPVYAKIQVQNIADAFSHSDPENEAYYQTNAAKYMEELDSLDFEIKSQLNGCDSDFLVFHNAFSYFAEEYDLTQHTIIPVTSTSHGEVTAKTLKDVISTAKRLDIKVIFSEDDVSTRLSEIIANEFGGKVLVLSPLEIFSDRTFISKMTENLENLKEALC